MKKNFLITIGIISIILGVIGIFLPVFPTTPFLIFSAYCFSKSSEKLYKRLTDNKIFGKYIKDYHERKGITLKNKIIVITSLIITSSISIYNVPYISLKLIIFFTILGVCIYLLRLKTLKN